MSFVTALTLFIGLYLFSGILDRIRGMQQLGILLILFLIFTLMVGSRNPAYWIDSYTYAYSFHETTNTLSTFSFNDKFYAYSEKGYYLLCVIAKTIADDTFVYFTFIAALSLFFVFYSLKKYSLLPVLGLCIYTARFMMARDMNQMRAGLAIAIIIAATTFIAKKEYLKYIIICILASYIHTSILIAIPLILFNMLPIRKIHILCSLVLAFLAAGFLGGTIKQVISNFDFVQELAKDYVTEGRANTWSNDLSNPMIYYQTIILLIFTYGERTFVRLTKYYYTIRNAYFYSTLLLIVLCVYGTVAGRTSTIFATYEIVILPLIIRATKKEYRVIPSLLVLGILIVFFIRNFN